jgi:hypothetical protein
VYNNLCNLEKKSTLLGNNHKNEQSQEVNMELQKILPNFVKEVVKQPLESIMTAEREVFIRKHGGTRNGFLHWKLRYCSWKTKKPENPKGQGRKV